MNLQTQARLYGQSTRKMPTSFIHFPTMASDDFQLGDRIAVSAPFISHANGPQLHSPPWPQAYAMEHLDMTYHLLQAFSHQIIQLLYLTHLPIQYPHF